MPEFESPAYVLHLTHKSTRSRIESAKPDKPLEVFVCPADDVTAQPIRAVGTRIHDGATFHVVVTREDGAEQYLDLIYKDLLEEIRANHQD